jgi:hypothetical protein
MVPEEGHQVVGVAPGMLRPVQHVEKGLEFRFLDAAHRGEFTHPVAVEEEGQRVGAVLAPVDLLALPGHAVFLHHEVERLLGGPDHAKGLDQVLEEAVVDGVVAVVELVGPERLAQDQKEFAHVADWEDLGVLPVGKLPGRSGPGHAVEHPRALSLDLQRDSSLVRVDVRRVRGWTPAPRCGPRGPRPCRLVRSGRAPPVPPRPAPGPRREGMPPRGLSPAPE